MARTLFSFASLPILAAGGAALALAQCSGAVSIGQNMGPDGGDDGSTASSSSSGGSGSGGTSSGTGGSSSGSGSSSGAGSSSGGASSSSGGGGCCPAGYTMYSCTYPGGAPGYACHNPALGCASSTTCGLGCDQAHAGVCGGSSSGGSGLRWVTTCGPPLAPANGCSADGGLRDDAGAPCPPLGSSCTQQGELCGTSGPYTCPVGEMCSTGQQVPCPISTRKLKDGISYLDEEGLRQLHDDTMRVQLATYNYKPSVSDPAPRHLGFIIEDMPPASPAVGWSRDHVDLYGYVSMVVATMQVQEKEIADLRRELAATKAGACR